MLCYVFILIMLSFAYAFVLLILYTLLFLEALPLGQTKPHVALVLVAVRAEDVGLLGWHYLSNATCLMRPQLFCYGTTCLM